MNSRRPLADLQVPQQLSPGCSDALHGVAEGQGPHPGVQGRRPHGTHLVGCQDSQLPLQLGNHAVSNHIVQSGVLTYLEIGRAHV